MNNEDDATSPDFFNSINTNDNDAIRKSEDESTLKKKLNINSLRERINECREKLDSKESYDKRKPYPKNCYELTAENNYDEEVLPTKNVEKDNMTKNQKCNAIDSNPSIGTSRKSQNLVKSPNLLKSPVSALKFKEDDARSNNSLYSNRSGKNNNSNISERSSRNKSGDNPQVMSIVQKITENNNATATVDLLEQIISVLKNTADSTNNSSFKELSTENKSSDIQFNTNADGNLKDKFSVYSKDRFNPMDTERSIDNNYQSPSDAFKTRSSGTSFNRASTIRTDKFFSDDKNKPTMSPVLSSATKSNSNGGGSFVSNDVSKNTLLEKEE
jgi:hypothetical protein